MQMINTKPLKEVLHAGKQLLVYSQRKFLCSAVCGHIFCGNLLSNFSSIKERETRDLAPKTKVLRCRHHRGVMACQWVQGGMSVGVVHHRGGTFHGWWHALGRLTLVLALLMLLGVASIGVKPKVSLLAKSLWLQYYFTPCSKAAK